MYRSIFNPWQVSMTMINGRHIGKCMESTHHLQMMLAMNDIGLEG
jgi:hypothetical protein